jgi:putative FmdB family regulatory protein
VYEYQCLINGHRFEVRHGINEEPVSICIECGGEVRRVIQPVGIVFKGSGFYANDSRKSAASSKPATPKSDSPGGETGGETGKTDSKPDTSTTSDGSTPAAKSEPAPTP